MSRLDSFSKVARLRDIDPGQLHTFVVKGVNIALANLGGRVFAIEDRCTHDNGPLADGRLEKNVIECPRHGAKFDVKTGAALSMPAVVPVRTFAVEIKDGDVFVKIE